MSVFTWNAAKFASTAEPYIDQERHIAVREAVQLIRGGQSDTALRTLAQSVERQNRIAGGGAVVLPICGRVLGCGEAS